MHDLRGPTGPLSRRRVLALIAGTTAGALVPGCSAPFGASPEPGGSSPAAAGDSTHPDSPSAGDQVVTAFLAAVRGGDTEAVARMLDDDARLARATDARGRSAFVLAHLTGHPDLAPLLAARGLELDVAEAVLAADWERVEALAAADSELMNRAHPVGGNPLYVSALGGGAEQYRLRALGCDSNGRPAGGSGFTPGRAAMDCVDPLGAWLAATDILSNGGDPDAPQTGGDSVLHGAVRARDVRLVRLVLRKGGAPGARDDQGRTPLTLARELDWPEGVALLEEQAAVPRDHRASQFAFDQNRAPFQRLSLDDVTRERQSEITGLSHFDRARVQGLLKEEPRLIHAISTDDELAIEACGHTGQREVIQLHLDHGAPLSLPTAISLGDLDHARWLLAWDPELVRERGPHDFPVMWYPAIGRGSVEAAELLLDHGADLEQQSGGETALHQAAWRGHPDLVAWLVERGADLEARGHRQVRTGATPLELAQRRGHDDVVRLLRDRGAVG